jgi:glycosyltransferase involved in cell wall biosynthesis
LVHDLDLENNITFTGFVKDEDLPNLYALAHVFIMAGTAELQSIVTMEAMATGLPIIAVDAMALPELVHDNANGFLFKHNDLESMAKAIERLFTDEDLYQAMSKKSLEIITYHEISKITNDFINLYSEVINKHEIR